MTIRMLKAWSSYPVGTIVTTLSGGEETRLVGIGFASYDLDGDQEYSYMPKVVTDENGLNPVLVNTKDNSAIPLGNNGIIITVTASRINALADLNNILECNSGSAINITVKPVATVPAKVNDIISIYQVGTGASLFVADTGVTIKGAAPTPTQDGHIAIRYRGSDVWAWI